VPVIRNLFGKLKHAARDAGKDRGQLAEGAAKKVNKIFFAAVVDKQPVAEADSWDQSTTSSERQGHVEIRRGWGEGPIVIYKSIGDVSISLRNVSEHTKYLVWSIGGIVNPKLGTRKHDIPPSGTAKTVYGHPLAFWWKKEIRPEVRWSMVGHPGTEGTLADRHEGMDFVQAAWSDVKDEAEAIIYNEIEKAAFGWLRRFGDSL